MAAKNFLLILFTAHLFSSCGIKQEPMPIYVEPFYNSNPFKIAVGEYSSQLHTNSKSSLRHLASEIKERVDEVNIETLFVLAIRMYDLGLKDEASYWYYTAQFRKNTFILMEDDAAHMSDMGEYLDAFNQLSGKWINGYAYGNPDKVIAILEQVIKDTKNMGYIKNAYPSYLFKPQEEQAAYVQQQADVILEHITYIRENKEEILRIRKENGMEGKY